MINIFRDGKTAESIHNRIVSTMLMWSLVIILVLGALSYFFMRNLLKVNVEREIDSQAMFVAVKFENAVEDVQEAAFGLSRNTLMLNAIIDTAGSSAYIEPFFASYRPKSGLQVKYTLCSFDGSAIASTVSPHSSYTDREMLARAVDHGEPFAKLLENPADEMKLLLAYPVVWEMTGKAEGMVVAEVSLGALFSGTINKADDGPRRTIKILSGERLVFSHGPVAASGYHELTRELSLNHPLSDLKFSIVIGEKLDMNEGMLIAAYLAATMIILFATYLTAGWISPLLTTHLSSLATLASAISESGSLTQRAEVAGPLEVRTLAESFNKMIDHLGESQKTLENRVRERTDELKRSEELYRTLVENIDLGISLVDRHFRIIMNNAAHDRLVEKAPGFKTGAHCYQAIHGRDSACLDCPGRMAMETCKKVATERGWKRADGNEAWYKIQAFPVRNEFGEPVGFIEVVEDLSEAKRHRDERERLERKMLQAQKLESLGILAGGIAHDFNNLLMGILGNVDLALGIAEDASPMKPFLDRINMASLRAAELTNQMLAYSGRGKFVVEAVDVSELVGEMEHLLGTVVSKNAEIIYELSENLPSIEADTTQIRQVVMNLITNASDALGEKNGRIIISTGVVDADKTLLHNAHYGEALPEGKYVMISVTDNGCGMSPEMESSIFDPFFTTKEKGRGLGLAAVQGIVRGHHGMMRVESRVGEGTCFLIYFPALAGQVEKPCPREIQPLPTLTGQEQRGAVLLVDDEAWVVEVTKVMLETSGFEVITAADGIEGVALFDKFADKISVVVMDMTMPRMGGLAAMRKIHQMRPGTPVILCSGYSEQEYGGRSSESGAAAFIQKPFRAKALLDKINEILATAACLVA